MDVKVEDMNQAASESRPETDAALLAQGTAEQLVRPGLVPPGDAPGRADRHEGRRARGSGAVRAAGWAAPRCRRREWYREGRVPLHTLRAKIDYGTAEAKTTFGVIGVKVWVYHGDELGAQEQEIERARARALAGMPARGPAAPPPARSSPTRGVEGAPVPPPGVARDTPKAAAAAPVRRRSGRPAGRPGQARRPGRSFLMLTPKKVKHRKQHRGRMRGRAKGGTEVHFGDYGLLALEPGWITNRQIEAARVAMTRHIRRGGKVWINIFPDKPVTKKPAETRMGSGKGNPEGWVAVVKPGRVMFELSGVPEPVAREAIRRAAHKLPIKTKFVARTGAVRAR